MRRKEKRSSHGKFGDELWLANFRIKLGQISGIVNFVLVLAKKLASLGLGVDDLGGIIKFN